MTATSKGTIFQVGDRVQIADPAYYREDSIKDNPDDYVDPRFYGNTGVVMQLADSCGNYEVRREDGGPYSTTNFIAPEFLTKITDEPKTERQELYGTGFAVGDRVRYTGRGVVRDDELLGKVGTVVEIRGGLIVWVQYDEDQELPEWLTLACDPRKGGHFPGNLERIEGEETTPVPAPEGLQVGDYVKVSSDPKYLNWRDEATGYVEAIFSGAIGRVKYLPADDYDGDGKNYYVELIFPELAWQGYANAIAPQHLTKITPEEVEDYKANYELRKAESARDEALKAQAEAEKALADFKAFVRSKVIEESEKQGWCSRTDSWLSELGLKGRFGDLPKGRGAVLLLKGNRIAVLKRPACVAEAFDIRGIGENVEGLVDTRVAAWTVEADLLEVLSEGQAAEEE